MRLIDADKIDYIMEDDENPSFLDYVRRSHIADEPTVKAIPIDWIHNYLDNTFLPESHFWVIQKMIKEWDKEHEKDI